jgi:hypothetical protein
MKTVKIYVLSCPRWGWWWTFSSDWFCAKSSWMFVAGVEEFVYDFEQFCVGVIRSYCSCVWRYIYSLEYDAKRSSMVLLGIFMIDLWQRVCIRPSAFRCRTDEWLTIWYSSFMKRSHFTKSPHVILKRRHRPPELTRTVVRLATSGWSDMSSV